MDLEELILLFLAIAFAVGGTIFVYTYLDVYGYLEPDYSRVCSPNNKYEISQLI